MPKFDKSILLHVILLSRDTIYFSKKCSESKQKLFLYMILWINEVNYSLPPFTSILHRVGGVPGDLLIYYSHPNQDRRRYSGTDFQMRLHVIKLLLNIWSIIPHFTTEEVGTFRCSECLNLVKSCKSVRTSTYNYCILILAVTELHNIYYGSNRSKASAYL